MWSCCMLSVACFHFRFNINGSCFLVDEELSTLSPLAVIVLHEDDVEVVLKEVKKEKVDEDEDTSNVEIEHHHIQSTIICHSCGAEFAEETELEKHRYIGYLFDYSPSFV